MGDWIEADRRNEAAQDHAIDQGRSRRRLRDIHVENADNRGDDRNASEHKGIDDSSGFHRGPSWIAGS
jgi:hypothetical protein